MARKSYTADERAAAIALYATDGPTAVQDQLGIDKGLVTRWAQKAGVATVANQKRAAAVEAARLSWELRRETLAHRIGEDAELALLRLEQVLGKPDAGELRIIDQAFGKPYDRIPDPSDAKALVVTLGTLIDKAQLLTGAATSRTESVSDIDAEVRRLTEKLALNDDRAAA